MPRRTSQDFIKNVLAMIYRHPTAEERAGILKQVREQEGWDAETILPAAIEEGARHHEENNQLRQGLEEARGIMGELRELNETLTQPPHHPAAFLETVPGDGPPRALVCHGAARRVVNLAPELDPDSLATGDQVLLSEKMNTALEKIPDPGSRALEVGNFQQHLPSGDLLVEQNEQKFLLRPVAGLPEIHKGDRIAFDRGAQLALFALPEANMDHLFMKEEPRFRWDDIGGLREAKEKLRTTAFLIRDHPELARKYDLRAILGILLHGMPGNGKSMLVQAFAAEIGATRVIYLRLSDLNNMYFGESERRVRMVFQELRRDVARNPGGFSVLAIEELDAVFASRGAWGSHVSDKVQNAILAELDGLTERGNILIIGTTNRADALDPAAIRPGRLGDCIIEIRSPDRADAREILGIHAGKLAAFADTSQDPAAVREQMIEAVLDRIYHPSGLGLLATLKLQDGSVRQVFARDLVSGAVLAKIKADAAETACQREAAGGEAGLNLEDFLGAVDEEFRRMARNLSPRNCHGFLQDLPHDNRVVDVIQNEEIRPRTYRVLRSA